MRLKIKIEILFNNSGSCVLSVCMYVCVLFCASVQFTRSRSRSQSRSRSRSRFIFKGSEPEPPEIGRLRNSGLFKYSDDYNRKQHICNFQHLRGFYLCYFMVIKLTNIMVKIAGSYLVHKISPLSFFVELHYLWFKTSFLVILVREKR